MFHFHSKKKLKVWPVSAFMCFCCNSLWELWLTDSSAQKSSCFCMKEILFLKLVSPGWLGAERRTDSGKLRLHEPNGPTSGPGHGGLSFPPEWWAFQAGLAASISRVCRPPFHRFLSSSQMTRSSSWGSSLSPPPLSSPTSWSPRTRAAQPMSRPSSEGGRAPERCTLGVGGRMHNKGEGGGGNILAKPQQVTLLCWRTDLQKPFRSRVLLHANSQGGYAKIFFLLKSVKVMPERSKDSHETLQRYPTDSSRHCQSRMGLVKGQTLRIVPRVE